MFDNSMNTLRELLKVAISTNDRLNVFDYTPDDEDEPRGLCIAEREDDDFQVIILPEERKHPVTTIAGDSEQLVVFFNIYMPKYDSGDASVGMDGYYYTDIEEPYHWSFPSAYDTAIKVASWLHEYQISLMVSNAAEYLYHQEQQDLEQI